MAAAHCKYCNSELVIGYRIPSSVPLHVIYIKMFPLMQGSQSILVYGSRSNQREFSEKNMMLKMT